MSFTDPSLWQLLYLQSFAGDYFGTLQLPIPTFDTPLVSQSIVRVKVTTNPSRPSWESAGHLRQIVNTGNVQACVLKVALDLTEDRMLFLEPISPCILRFSLVKWLPQATISIFGYTGSTADPSSPFLLGL